MAIPAATEESGVFTVPGTPTAPPPAAPSIDLNGQIAVGTSQVENYRLRGFGGDDIFNITPQADIAIRVDGDEPSGSDLVNFNVNNAVAAPRDIDVELDTTATLDPGVQTIQQDTLGVVTLSGIETANIEAADNADVENLYIAGTRFDDVITYTPLSANDGTVLRNVTLDDGTATVGTAGIIEAVEVVGNDADDTIQVEPAPAVGAGLYVNVDGGSPQASDALVIGDLTGAAIANLPATDFVVVGQSRVPDAGKILTFRSTTRLPGVAYENIEVVSPLVATVNADTGDPNLLILGPDMYEQNEYRATAAYLGSGDALNVQNLTIFPTATEHAGVPADVDYFRVVAETTGVLDFTIYFHDLNNLVPGDGNLDVRVLDSDGSVIAGTGTFGNQDGTENARIRIPAISGQTYYLHVAGNTDDVVNGYDLTVDNYAPPTPFDIELLDNPVGDDTLNNVPNNSDTGRSQFDNNTRDNTPTLVFRLDDGIFLHDLPGNDTNDTPADEVIVIPFQGGPVQPITSGYAIAIFDEGNSPAPGTQTGTQPQTPLGFATAVPGQEGVYQFTTPTLTDGSHFLTARVQMIDPASPQQTGWGTRSDSLEIIVNTVEPPVSFGDATATGDGLHPDSDSGVAGGLGNESTLDDRITNDETPTFWGRAEADAFIRVYVDTDLSNTVTAGDVLIGETTAIVLDGSNQFPNGRWELTSTINMNDPDMLAALGAANIDGLRRILVTGEDIPGNVNDVTGVAEVQQILDIFVDTQGPQIFDPDGPANPARHAIEIVGHESYDLFDHKDTPDGTLVPTPLVNSLRINVRDLPDRVTQFLYNALQENTAGDPAEDPGNFRLVGDANGVIPIDSIVFTPTAPAAGSSAEGEVILTFDSPLPDDRFTLTVSDDVVDVAGNALDGENNAAEPQEPPVFPTGDGQPGGDFVARFTVDSRPEIGVYHSGSVWVDTNGNSVYDPDNLDYTNRDITYMLGVTTDDLFAGNFVANPGDTADGFDKLAAYGRIGSNFRWLIDFDNDGVWDTNHVDNVAVPPVGFNGLPVAGNFDGDRDKSDGDQDALNGDEVALFGASTWWFDTDHDFRVDARLDTPNLTGLPIVGDFDGNGVDDLGAWQDDQFSFLLNPPIPPTGGNSVDPRVPLTIDFGFIGVREMPVAADMDQDGIDDIGLWVPDRAGVNPENSAEWYFLVSNDPLGVNRAVNTVVTLDHRFEPVPFGPDMHAVFGDEFGVPLVGNFDPPATPITGEPWSIGATNPDNPYDVNGDGYVTTLDVLIVISRIQQDGTGPLAGPFSTAGPYVDAYKDGVLSTMDVLAVVGAINDQIASGGEGEQARVALDATAADATVEEVASIDQLFTVEVVSPATAGTLEAAPDAPSAVGVDSYLAERDEQPVREASLVDDELVSAVLDNEAEKEDESPIELDSMFDLDDVLSDIAADVSRGRRDD